jgi:hypothetical protein
MVAVAARTDAWARRARAGRGVAPASWTVPVLAAAGAAALAGLLVPLGGLAQPDGTAELAATWAGLGALAVGVAVWRRWPMLAVLGVVVTVAGGAVAGRTWFAAALGWATLVTALWARLRRRPSLRILTALLGAATLQAGLWAAQADAELWTWTDMAGGALAAMAALAIWRRRVRARWLPALVVFAPLLSTVGLLVAFVAGDSPLLVAALLVAGLQAAVAGLVTSSPWLAASAPVLVCAAWLEFARLSLRGDPQWFTVPIGLTLLTVVEIARGHRRRTGQRVAGPELVALELAGMLLVVGAALFQTATASLLNGLLATLFGAGLLGWGVLTRVRRRASVGAATVALAALMLVTVPVARMLPAVRGPVLWLTLAAAGLVLLLVASSIERGRARARAAARRIDQLLVGWE